MLRNNNITMNLKTILLHISKLNTNELVCVINLCRMKLGVDNLDLFTDIDAKDDISVEMDWIPWSDKSKGIPFESTKTGIGDGEEKVSAELDTPIFGQNSSYDMMPIINGIKTKCDIKKLDTQNDFNTGKEGRDVLRPYKMLHSTLLESLNTFAESNQFTDSEKAQIASLNAVSPDELAVGTLKKITCICEMLSLKKKALRSTIPFVPITIFGQTQNVSLDLYYKLCIESNVFTFPSEYSKYIETIHVLQKMNHTYIDEPDRFMADLNGLIDKLFSDMKLIIVDKNNGYMIIPDNNMIQFYRITRGNPRFKVLF